MVADGRGASGGVIIVLGVPRGVTCTNLLMRVTDAREALEELLHDGEGRLKGDATEARDKSADAGEGAAPRTKAVRIGRGGGGREA